MDTGDQGISRKVLARKQSVPAMANFLEKCLKGEENYGFEFTKPGSICPLFPS
jgi:hypothetical protein